MYSFKYLFCLLFAIEYECVNENFILGQAFFFFKVGENGITI